MTQREIEVRDARDTLGRFRVVDVREAHEFEGPLGRIAGAELLPLGQVAERAASFAPDQPLLLVCRSGRRSDDACAALRDAGVSEAVNLLGGMIAWNQAGLPIEDPIPASLQALAEQVLRWTAQVGPQSLETLRSDCRDLLGAQGSAATAASVDTLIERSRAGFADEPPADFELSIASFRRWLTALEAR